MVKLMQMANSTWRMLGIILTVLGVASLIGGIVAYVRNYVEYVNDPIVFGGIFIIVGVGLVVITFFEKEQGLTPPAS